MDQATRTVSLALMVGALLMSGFVGLTPQSAQAQAPAADIDFFNVSPHLTDDLVLGSNKTLRHLQVSAQAMGSWSHVTLKIQGARTERVLVENRVRTDLGLSLGFLGWMEAGLSVPVIVYNGALEDAANRLQPEVAGYGDLNLSFKARLLNGCGQFLDGYDTGWSPPWRMNFGVQLGVQVPTGDGASLFGGKGLRFRPKFVWSANPHDRVALGAEAGFVLRTAHDKVLNLDIGQEFGWAAGITYVFKHGVVDLQTVIRSVLPMDSGRISDAGLNPYELDVWVRWMPTPGLQVILGAGTGIIRAGYGAPDARVLFGLGSTFQVLPDSVEEDLDRDGIPDPWDRCICSDEIL